MITREKNVNFEVIAIPVDKISYFKTEDENTDITLSVPGWHAAEDGPMESYYVLKRPASINEDIFKVALEAALRTLAALNPGKSLLPQPSAWQYFGQLSRGPQPLRGASGAVYAHGVPGALPDARRRDCVNPRPPPAPPG